MLKLTSVRMERAAKSFAKLKLDAAISQEDLARAAWPAAVGRRIAVHAAAKSVVRGRLIVEVDDAVWQKQLFHLRIPILTKLSETVEESIVNDIEFRLTTPRRPPQTSKKLTQTKPTDEADGIADPIMRILYKQARKKAS